MTSKKRKGINYHKHKLYFKNDTVIRSRIKWKWPFIDIKFYKQDNKHVFKYDKGKHPKTLIADFYPLHKRPFAQFWLPSPHQTAKGLREKYKNFKCKSSSWDHQHEQKTPKKNKITFKCEDLSSGVFTSVEHIPYGVNKTAELLWHNNKLKYAVILDVHTSTYIPPYKI